MLPIIRDVPTQPENIKNDDIAKRTFNENGSTPNFTISGNKVFFISLGCPRNLVDTEVMLGILLKAGYEPAPEIDTADFIVINTCGFLEASRQESVDTIRESLKNKKAGAKVIATGCMVQTHSDVIKKECPDIHYLLGSGDVQGILKAVESDAAGNEITQARSFLEMGEIPRVVSTPKHYAYLKIAEGCRKRCAFCIIPSIKGPLKSKPEEQILKELNVLLNQGVKEVILIAQDLGDYGKDQGFKKSDGLVQLLRSILQKEKRDFWLRLLYLYPDEITDDLIALIKSDKRICHYLDMPIQHVNNDLLKSMRRLTSREDITSSITKLRKEIPDIVIRTSLIVGFPGETEEQFQELEEFIRKYPLENIGIFKYSNEETSHSATLPNHISEEVKQSRLERLVKLQRKNVDKINKKMVGKRVEAVVEGFHPDSKLLIRGRYYGQCPEIDGEIIINDFKKVKGFGERYTVEITGSADYDLIGRVV
jgi:ribosomal protein S12 methylthiotransferase